MTRFLPACEERNNNKDYKPQELRKWASEADKPLRRPAYRKRGGWRASWRRRMHTHAFLVGDEDGSDGSKP